MIRLLALILGFLMTSAWGQESYRFELEINSQVQTLSVELNRSNSFKALVTIPKVDRVWYLNITSNDVPRDRYRYSLSGSQLLLELLYPDPLFYQISFHSLKIFDWCLLLENESPESMIRLIDLAAQNLRIDLMQVTLEKSERPEIYLRTLVKGIFYIWNAIATNEVYEILQTMVDSELGNKDLVDIARVAVGTAGGKDFLRLQQKILADEELKGFVLELIAIAPDNLMLQYLIKTGNK